MLKLTINCDSLKRNEWQRWNLHIQIVPLLSDFLLYAAKNEMHRVE